MSVYDCKTVTELLQGNAYPGRGVLIGTTPDGKKAATAYFIMGRSANSRNRIFVKKGNDVFTEPFDPAKVVDPSLIIYAAVRDVEGHLIVTNGDQTDTVKDGYAEGKSFEVSLQSREFEPDRPNYTPRISGVLNFPEAGKFDYELSILKSADAEGTACARFHFAYPASAGVGHLIHTYVGDGSPLPTFQGEPKRVLMNDDIDAFTDELWNALDPDNRISLYVCYVNIENGQKEDRLVNKY